MRRRIGWALEATAFLNAVGTIALIAAAIWTGGPVSGRLGGTAVLTAGVAFVTGMIGLAVLEDDYWSAPE